MEVNGGGSLWWVRSEQRELAVVWAPAVKTEQKQKEMEVCSSLGDLQRELREGYGGLGDSERAELSARKGRDGRTARVSNCSEKECLFSERED